MTELDDGGAGRPAGAARARGLLAAVLTLGMAAWTAPPAAAQDAGAAGARGQEGRIRLSLDDAVRRAVSENEQVLIARAEAARTAGIVTETRAGLFPDLNLNLGYTRNLQTPVLFFGGPGGDVQQISLGSDNEIQASLSFEQPLLDFSLGPARAAARLSRSASKAEVAAARKDVALAAKAGYYRVLLDRELVRVQERALEQARDRLEQVRSFYEAGTGSEFDLLTARVEVDNIRPELIEARNRLEQDRDELKRTVGVPLDRGLVLTDSLARPPESELPPMDSAVQVARAHRSDLESQRVRVGLQQQNLNAAQGEDLPEISAIASLSRRASSDDLIPGERDFSQTATAGLNVSLPLFDGRAQAGRVQQAKAAVERERYRLEQLEEQVRLDVQQARQALESAREQIRASEANVERAERALEIAQTRFRNGLSTQVELNDAELAVTEARSNFARALFNYYVARAQLTAARGQR